MFIKAPLNDAVD